MSNLDSFRYVFIDNQVERTLFLFHGTGGNENDFLFINDLLKHRYNLVGLRGNINENGMNRFFRRNTQGVYDQKNIKEETEKLTLFIKEFAKIHTQKIDDFTYLGYSNGANILLASLFYFPESFKKLFLLHPMIPFMPSQSFKPKNHSIYLTYGLHDEMCPPEKTMQLIDIVRNRGVKVTVHSYESGHEITQMELSDVVSAL